MASFRLWTIQNSPMPARADHCGAPTHRAGHPKSCRSPLRDHFDFQANIATCRSGTIQNSPRARARAWEFCTNHTNARTAVNFRIQSVAVKGPLWFTSQQCDFSIVGNTALPTRGGALDFSRFLWVLADSSGFIRIPRESTGFCQIAQVPKDSAGFFQILWVSQQLFGIHRDPGWFRSALQDSR